MINKKEKLPSLKKTSFRVYWECAECSLLPQYWLNPKSFLKRLIFKCEWKIEAKNYNSCVFLNKWLPNQADPSYREPLLVWVSPSALLINFIYQARQPLPMVLLRNFLSIVFLISWQWVLCTNFITELEYCLRTNIFYQTSFQVFTWVQFSRLRFSKHIENLSQIMRNHSNFAQLMFSVVLLMLWIANFWLSE